MQVVGVDFLWQCIDSEVVRIDFRGDFCKDRRKTEFCGVNIYDCFELYNGGRKQFDVLVACGLKFPDKFVPVFRAAGLAEYLGVEAAAHGADGLLAAGGEVVASLVYGAGQGLPVGLGGVQLFSDCHVVEVAAGGRVLQFQQASCWASICLFSPVRKFFFPNWGISMA